MIVYNVTTKIDSSIKNEWLAWLEEEHVPDILNTGCFTESHTFQLLETDDSEGPTYIVQYFAESKSFYNLYIENFADFMREKAFAKWGNKFISFRSLMQEVY